MSNDKQNEYNGWTNWDTWNANLWLNNDEGTYHMLQSCKSASDVRELYHNQFSHDHDGIDSGYINWIEIFGAIS